MQRWSGNLLASSVDPIKSILIIDPILYFNFQFLKFRRLSLPSDCLGGSNHDDTPCYEVRTSDFS